MFLEVHVDIDVYTLLNVTQKRDGHKGPLVLILLIYYFWNTQNQSQPETPEK